MLRFTVLRGYLVDCNPDGAVPLSAHVYAAQDKGDTAGKALQIVADHANLGADAVDVLRRLRRQFDALPAAPLGSVLADADAILTRAQGLQ